MDLENKPNMERTRIGGGQADVYVDSDWWWTGGCICGLGLVVDRVYVDSDWWWYIDTDAERWRMSNGGRWQGDDDRAAAARQLMTRTRNSKRLDSKTSNLTRRCNRKFNKAKTLKRLCKGSDWFGYDELTLNFLCVVFRGL